jgi:hypothetical protein
VCSSDLLWNKAMVKIAVRKGALTKEQYQAITGEVYIAAGEARNVWGRLAGAANS